MKLFKEISDRFKEGTVNLAIQMHQGQMAVMVTFKGIDCAPRVLKGSPEEIDENFIENLESVLNLASEINEHNMLKELEKIRAEQLKEEKKKESEENKKEKEEKAKKEEKLKAAQTSLIPETKEEKNPAKKKDDPPVSEPKVNPVAPLTNDEKDLVKRDIESSGAEVWDCFDVAWRTVAKMRSISKDEATQLVHDSNVVQEFEASQKKKSTESTQDHKKNVAALKQDLELEDTLSLEVVDTLDDPFDDDNFQL